MGACHGALRANRSGGSGQQRLHRFVQRRHRGRERGELRQRLLRQRVLRRRRSLHELGGGEFSGETSYDSYFKKSGVVYVASSGDAGGIVEYPSSSPDAVAAGGSSLKFNGTPSASTFTSEVGWCDGGGGKSLYEARPAYQNGITLVGAARGVPDLAFDADPDSGVDVYDSTACGGYAGWLVFGGTSVAAPALAGVINSAAHFYASSTLELDTIYSIYNTKKSYEVDYRDITSGKAGAFSAGVGWDFITGVGSPLTYAGK